VNCIKNQPIEKGQVNIKDLPWNFCWDFLSAAGCRKGAKCKWIHESKAISKPPAQPQLKPLWPEAGTGTYQYGDTRQTQQDVAQLQCGVDEQPYDKAIRASQLAPTSRGAAFKNRVPNLSIQQRDHFLLSASSRAEGFIPRANAKEFVPTGKDQPPKSAHIGPSKTPLKPQNEQLASGTQISNVKLSSDHESNLFGSFAGKRKNSGVSANTLEKMSQPSSSQNTGFSNQRHSSLAQWSGKRSPMESQGFQKPPGQSQVRFSPRSAASMPQVIHTNDMIPFRTPEGSMMFLPWNTYLPRTNSGHPGTFAAENNPRKWRDRENISAGQFFSRESNLHPRPNRLLLSKNLRRDQVQRHTLYLNALSRAGLVPKSAWPSALTGSSDMTKLRNSRAVMWAAAGGGTNDCSNRGRRSELTRKAIKLHNSNITQKLNLLNSGFLKTSAEMGDHKGDGGPNKVSYANKHIEKGDTTGSPFDNGRSPFNVFSPPFKAPAVKSHQACYHRSRGARPTGTVRGWPPNSAPRAMGRGSGGNDPDKLKHFLKRGENTSSQKS